ncbi:hypothetical protein AB0D08_35255 [Kitasatospora sp. NPDC048540]
MSSSAGSRRPRAALLLMAVAAVASPAILLVSPVRRLRELG